MPGRVSQGSRCSSVYARSTADCMPSPPHGAGVVDHSNPNNDNGSEHQSDQNSLASARRFFHMPPLDAKFMMPAPLSASATLHVPDRAGAPRRPAAKARRKCLCLLLPASRRNTGSGDGSVMPATRSEFVGRLLGALKKLCALCVQKRAAPRQNPALATGLTRWTSPPPRRGKGNRVIAPGVWSRRRAPSRCLHAGEAFFICRGAAGLRPRLAPRSLPEGVRLNRYLFCQSCCYCDDAGALLDLRMNVGISHSDSSASSSLGCSLGIWWGPVVVRLSGGRSGCWVSPRLSLPA